MSISQYVCNKAMYYHVLPCTATYSHVLLFIIYILRNTPQKAIFVRKLVLANQRSERWFSDVKKMIRPIRIANDVFSRVRKMIRPIRGHRGVRVSRQNSRLLLQLAAPLRTRSTRKVFLKEFFSLKKWKTFRKWSGIVSFVSLSIKKTDSRRNNSGKGKTERDVSFCCAFCRSYFAFHLSLRLYWNRPFYLNSLIFNWALRTIS